MPLIKLPRLARSASIMRRARRSVRGQTIADWRVVSRTGVTVISGQIGRRLPLPRQEDPVTASPLSAGLDVAKSESAMCPPLWVAVYESGKPLFLRAQIAGAAVFEVLDKGPELRQNLAPVRVVEKYARRRGGEGGQQRL